MSKPAVGISSLRTVGTFAKGRACSDTLFHVLAGAYGDPMAIEERAVVPLAGGILRNGYQCGMLWGAALAAGARAYRLLGAGPRAEAGAIEAARRLAESFRARNHSIDCYDITETDRTSSTLQLVTYFLLKGGTVGCFRMAAEWAPVAFGDVDAALGDAKAEAPPAPVSCSAELARRMGASDLHAAMAAGFAGGIGLCGGACGALGAAIWIRAMASLERDGKVTYEFPAAQDTIDRFLKSTRCEFECSRIVGREFRSVADHAAYLREGGCSRIIDALAAA